MLSTSSWFLGAIKGSKHVKVINIKQPVWPCLIYVLQCRIYLGRGVEFNYLRQVESILSLRDTSLALMGIALHGYM